MTKLFMILSRPWRRGRWMRITAGSALLSLVAACSSLPATAPASLPPVQTATVTPKSAEPDPSKTATATPVASPAEPSMATADTPTPGDEARPSQPVTIDPLRPDVPPNLDEQTNRSDLWIRVRKGFAMPDLDTDLVRNREQWYASRPDYVQRMTERGSRYLFHIVEEVERRGMPSELALLPFIESAFNPQAMSSAKASGMWQFMPATGRYFDLKQNMFRDDRRDVLASTRAALDYLQKLHGMFGDWHLALAAYNWGEGSVQRAMARNRKAGLPTDYTSLRMPLETQYYVPKLQAVKNIIARPEQFGLTLPPIENHPYFLSVAIERDMDVELAAKLAHMELNDFKALNPQMNKPVILASVTPQVLLPFDNAKHFTHNLPRHEGPLASWTAWVALKTIRPADAAKEVGMTEEALRDINRIPPRMLVKAGSTLLVPRHAHRHSDVAVHVADNAVMTLAPESSPLRKVSLKAGSRETVASVARRYRLSATQVAEWNQVGASAKFKPGQTVVVFLPHKGKGSARTIRARSAPSLRAKQKSTQPSRVRAKVSVKKRQ